MKNHARQGLTRSQTYIVKENQEKINSILLGALTALAEKGYANTIIQNIARASRVSKGLLHYYFGSKEDLILQAISLGSNTLLSSPIERIKHANSSEHLADIMIEVLRQNVEQHPRVTGLIIEAWGQSRRSDKLRSAFEVGIKNSTEKLATFLKPHISSDPHQTKLGHPEMTIRILLGLYQGLAIQLISQPDLLNDDHFRDVLRSIVIHALKSIISQSSD